MSDVNTFIDTIGKDVSATVVPRIEGLVQEISTKTFDQYGPRVSTFATQLVKDIINEQSATVREFVTGAIQDVFGRYRPELAGELHTRVVQGGLEVTGRGLKLDLTQRYNGATVSSPENPVALTIKVESMGLTLQNATVDLDVV